MFQYLYHQYFCLVPDEQTFVPPYHFILVSTVHLDLIIQFNSIDLVTNNNTCIRQFAILPVK